MERGHLFTGHQVQVLVPVLLHADYRHVAFLTGSTVSTVDRCLGRTAKGFGMSRNDMYQKLLGEFHHQAGIDADAVARFLISLE